MALHGYFASKGFITASINFRQVCKKEALVVMDTTLSLLTHGGVFLGVVDDPKDEQVGQGCQSVAITRLSLIIS